MIKKRKVAICLTAMITMPLLFGFKLESDKDFSNLKSHAVDDNQPSGRVLDRPFEDVNADNKLKEQNSNGNNAEKNPSENIFNKSISMNNSPQESQVNTKMREYLRQFEGLTIVDIKHEGASDSTLPTVKAAIILHVGDEFSADAAIRDRDAIRNTGYFYDAYQTFEKVPEGVIITYHMMENPVLKKIVINGNSVISTSELNRLLTVKRGSILNSNTLHDNVNAIQEKYHGDGYILMKITDISLENDGTLTLKINEGILEGYKVKDNKKTKDYVITREMRQKPGEPFNAKKARRSMERVYNLGFFEDVNVKMLPGVEPNAVVMEINVKEKRTGTFGVGAGYSTRDGLLGVVSISDTNFRGTGDAVSLSFEKNADDSDAHGFAFTYRKPWLDHHETAATLRIYNRTYQYYDYDTDAELKERYMRKYSGGEITLSRPMSEYSTNYITLKNRKDRYVRHVSSGKSGDRSGSSGESWRNDNFGTTRSIEFQHITDTRDNVFNPTIGGKVTLGTEFGGLLGGDFTFQKYTIDHQQYFKAGHAQVWAFKTAYGIGHGDLTEFNQFRVGGQNSLRGYRDDQFRGDRMMLAALEYRFPLARRIQGIVFTDWGGAWDSRYLPKGNAINGSVGLGVALNTPLGPLRLDYGRGKQGGRFHFNIGGGF